VLEGRHLPDALGQERQGRLETLTRVLVVLAEVDDHVADVDRPEARDGGRGRERVQRADVRGIAGRKPASGAVDERTPVGDRAEEPEGLEMRNARLVHRQHNDRLQAAPGGEPPVGRPRAGGDARERQRHGPGLDRRQRPERAERHDPPPRTWKPAREGRGAESGQDREPGRDQNAEACRDPEGVEARDEPVELRVERLEAERLAEREPRPEG
jgi:hypothetical protein